MWSVTDSMHHTAKTGSARNVLLAHTVFPDIWLFP